VGSGRIAVVFGTRPELIKLSGIVRGLGSRSYAVHTGQHYDPAMSSSFLDELGIGPPDTLLDIGGRSRGHQIGVATERLDALFADLEPAAVVVQGDTNATVAGAIAANARELPLVHVEAGLRSYDRRMPEEHNRVLVDHLADLCLAPTTGNAENLVREGIDRDRIEVTGNTIVDVAGDLLPSPQDVARVAARHGVEPGAFILATFHRPENVDDPERLATILGAAASFPLPAVLPMHPRTAAQIDAFGLTDRLSPLRITEPVGYRELLALLSGCALVVSDSGGIVEEATVVKRPVVVVRRSTERPEAFDAFARSVSPDAIAAAVTELAAEGAAVRHRLAALPSPFGDGQATARTLAAIRVLADGGGGR
jgi:UDP-N-acetylglucosamine 2-epimerase (non-hydrolysing)